jgi:ribosomal protein S18 acetylase RimI-like enzyme
MLINDKDQGWAKAGYQMKKIAIPRVQIGKITDKSELIAIAETCVPIDSNAYATAALIRYIVPAAANCGFVIGAKAAGKIVGFNYGLVSLELGSMYFAYIWVDPRFRNKSIALKIHQLAEKTCKKMKFHRLFCTVSPYNAPCLELLLNEFGWHIYDLKTNYYGEGEHRLFLEKNKKIGERKPSSKLRSFNEVPIAKDGELHLNLSPVLIDVGKLDLISEALHNRLIGTAFVTRKKNDLILFEDRQNPACG